MSDLLNIKNLVVEIKSRNGSFVAVNGVNLDIKRGETVALVGESGCGKSTLVNSILKLRKHTHIRHGEIMYNGEDLAKKSEKELRQIRRKQISVIFQNPDSYLNPFMHIGRQVAESAALKSRKQTKHCIKSRSIDVLRKVGIPDAELRAKEYPFNLSSGIRQRVIIAAAIASDPCLLMADEFTTALDVLTQSRVIALLKKLQIEMGLSLLMVTHDLGLAASCSDRIFVMYRGKIVEHATTEDIFHRPSHPYTAKLISSVTTMPNFIGQDII